MQKYKVFFETDTSNYRTENIEAISIGIALETFENHCEYKQVLGIMKI